MIDHPIDGPLWKSLRPTPADYARISIPILTITGHYDDDQPGAMHYYRSHMEHGTADAKARHFLLVGPWDHAGTRTPNKDVGGLTFGPASLLDLNALHKAWYDWTMKDAPKPEFLKERVNYYVVPSDQWKHAPSLEAVSRKSLTFYLGSKGSADDTFRSGELSPQPPAGAASDRYTYDPLDKRPAGLETEWITNYLTDQRYVLNTFGNGVFYTTAPFEKPTEITGSPRLSVWIALDVRDTDFRVSLYEVLSDGTSVLLAEDTKRARHRASRETETFVRSGEVLRYDFDSFPFFSRRVAVGSRLRLFLRCPNTIYAQKNYNSGGTVAEETPAVARTAHVVVHHSREYPSALTLPVVN